MTTNAAGYVEPALAKLRRISTPGRFDTIGPKDATVLLLYINTLESAVRDMAQEKQVRSEPAK